MEPPVPRETASGRSSPSPAEDRPATAAPGSPNLEPPPDADAVVGGRPRPTGRRLGAPTPRAALAIGAALLGVAIMLAAFDAVRPFLLGAVLVYLMAPLVDRLASVGIPRAAAVLLTFITVIFIVVVVIMLSLSPLVAQLQRFIRDVPTIIHDARPALEDFYAGLNLSPEVRAFVDSVLASLAEGAGGVDVSGVVGPVVGSLFSVLGTVTAYAILPAWLFFLLKDRRRLTDSLERSLPQTWRADTFAIFALVDRVFGNWIRGQLVLGATVGVFSFIGLELLSALVDPVFGRYAILLALIAGVLELVPFIGPIISAIPAVLIGLTAGPQGFIAAFLLYLAIQQVENNLLVPKIQGDAVELHPSVVMLALVVGTALAGILGAIISLPVAAAARDVFRYLFQRLSDPPSSVAEALASVSPKLVASVRPSALASSAAGGGLAAAQAPGTGAPPAELATRSAPAAEGGAAAADGA